MKLVVLVWKGVLSALREASLALFDSLRTSQKSDSSAKIKFASVSLPLGISIAVGRGRAVAARWPLLLAC